MIKKITLYCVLAVLTITSCNNLSEPNLSEEKGNSILFGEELSLDNGTLVFNSQSSFNNVINKLKEQSSSTKSNRGASLDVKNCVQIEGFNSLYNLYTQAIGEAEQYYDTEESYNRFKEKYAELYFPEEENDYSAFLPVSDETIAKLLNPKGEVVIAGKTCNMKDINSFQQLKELGRTMPATNIIVAPESTTRSLPIVTCSQLNGNGEVIQNHDGTRRMWVYVRNRPSTAGLGYRYEIFFEVCFRKIGFLNIWYNYSSASDITISSSQGNYWYDKSGLSSHDYIIQRRIDDSAGFPTLIGNALINHRGFADQLFYRVNFQFPPFR